jgi:hypothetical protein
MKLFNCNVRLGGNLLHSVPKIGITEKELYLLRAIHGDDSIENPRPAGEAEIEERAHLFELARVYGRPLVEKTFQTVLTNFDEWLQGILDAEEEEREERATVRKSTENKRKAEAAAAKAAEEAAAAEAAAKAAEEKDKQDQLPENTETKQAITLE